MKKENRWDVKAKAPDPDDLTSDRPREPRSQMTPDALQKFEEDVVQGEARENPDISTPHVPPAD